MKLGLIKRIRLEDLAAKGEIPDWLDPFVTTLNMFIEPVANALQGRLTFEDNFSCKKLSQKFTSGVPQKINPGSQLRVQGMIPVYFGGKTLTGHKLEQNQDGTVTVTLTFAEGASIGAVDCIAYLLLG